MSANKSSNLAAVKILHIFNLLFQSFTSTENKMSLMDIEQTSCKNLGVPPENGPIPEPASREDSWLPWGFEPQAA